MKSASIRISCHDTTPSVCARTSRGRRSTFRSRQIVQSTSGPAVRRSISPSSGYCASGVKRWRRKGFSLPIDDGLALRQLVRDTLLAPRSEVIVNNAPRHECEVGPPVKTVEHIDDRQPMNGGLSVRAQFDGARPAPAFVHADVRQSPCSQLTDGGAAVNLIDRFQVDVEGEIEMSCQAVETIWPLSRRHGSGQHVDPVAPDDADCKVATNLEVGLAHLLWLAVHLSAMRDSDIG